MQHLDRGGGGTPGESVCGPWPGGGGAHVCTPPRSTSDRGSVGGLVGAPNPGTLVSPDASSGSQELFAIAFVPVHQSISGCVAVWPYRGHVAEGGRPCVSLGAVPLSCGLGVCGRRVPTISNEYRFLMNSH